MDWFRSFATEGLTFPALMIAAGSAMILRAPYARRLTPDEVKPFHPVVRYMATRHWDRRCGWITIASSLVIALVRLTR